MSKPYWKNLLQEKCPVCAVPLIVTPQFVKCQANELPHSSKYHCGFNIGSAKYHEIRNRIQDDERPDNQTGINNL